MIVVHVLSTLAIAWLAGVETLVYLANRRARREDEARYANTASTADVQGGGRI